ncbi:MAG: DUF4388 domain-containing protein [Actinomycetia bacterium]|nr:DUF4388 domain-containing protein [Actinomycetes bacterium]
MITSEEAVSLQGTLDTFALPDVLRLVASTRKTGLLRVSGSRGEGSIWVEDGDIVAGSVTSAEQGADYATQVFDLLRFPDGSFMFESDCTAPEPGAPSEIEPVLLEAETLLAEWRNIETVIPSGDSWMNLAEELPNTDVVIDRPRWQVIVAVGAGSTVLEIGAVLGLGEIQVARELKEMVELGLIDVGAPTGSNLAAVAAPEILGTTDAIAEVADTNTELADTASAKTGAPDEVAFAKAPASAPFDDQPRFVSEVPALTDDITTEPSVGEFGADGAPEFDASSFGSEISFGESPLAGDPFGDNTTDTDLATSGPMESGPGLGDAPLPPPPPPPAPLPGPVAEPDASDPAEVARQLANLSPRAARAVAAAARAGTDEEREAVLADMDDADEPLNRGLLMKFLSNE